MSKAGSASQPPGASRRDAPAPEPVEIIEAALFASGKTVSKEELAAMAGVTPDQAERLVKGLRKAYEGRAVEIADLEGRYIMQVRPALASCVRTLAPMELDPSILRTLSVIAYNRPVAQADVVRVRGAKTYDHVRFLEERKLVKSKPYGHTKILETTEEFDAYFMVDASYGRGEPRQSRGFEKLERPEGTTLALPAPGSPESASVAVSVEANSTPVETPKNAPHLAVRPAPSLRDGAALRLCRTPPRPRTQFAVGAVTKSS